jgi:flagellar biosynthesis anti-sigma factor FlgM
MVTKIKDTTTQVIQQYQKSDPVRKEPNKTAGSGATVATERVDLSSKAKDFQRIQQILEKIPDVRPGKIQELKEQIESGNYKVDSEKVAAKMVGESLIDTIA